MEELLVKDLKINSNFLGTIDENSLEKMTKLYPGSRGIAYLAKGNVALKLQKVTGSKMQYDTVSKIKNLNLPNFYRIHEVLGYGSSLDKKFVGTISSYYEESDVNIWEKPSSYLIDNFKRIENSVNTLSKNGIKVVELYPCNAILGDKDITIIDVDNYKEGKVSECSSYNENELIHSFLIPLLARNYCNNFSTTPYSPMKCSKLLQEKLSQALRESDVETLFSQYEKPVDWLGKKLKK